MLLEYGREFFATYNEPVRHNDKTIIIAGR